MQQKKDDRKGKMQILDEIGEGECKPCAEGYQQGEDCRCNAAQEAAPICGGKDWVLDTEQCTCAKEGEEPADVKCLYGYRADDNCVCQRPPQTCEIKCEKGQKPNLWDCICEDMPVCEPCTEKGMKQHPWTCECRSYLTMDLKCRFGMDLLQDTCMCSKTNDNGQLKEIEARCRPGYDVSEDCSTCTLQEDLVCKRRKCPNGQGWDSDECMCGTLPACAEDVLECE